MKLLYLLIFVNINSWAVGLPLELFDQSKLESILREIPSAKLEVRNMGTFVRKSYRYPKTASSFVINCEADHYNASPIPTEKRCTITISDTAEIKGDEYLFRRKYNSVVNEMFNSLSYGREVKKSYSHERVYGQAYEGNYQDLFRYMIVCKKDVCEFRFTPKEAI